MNNLLPELMFLIYDYLDINDIILNCKLVNQRWKSLVDNYKFKKLIILNPKVYLDVCWISSKRYKIIEYNRTSFTWNLELLLNAKSFSKNFNCLRFLKIHYPFEDPSILNALNHCKNLRHLEISFINTPKHLIDKTSLKLPNLRVLKIDMAIYFSSPELEIDAIKLEELFCDNLKPIKLVHSHSIKFVKLSTFGTNINDLVNLETIFCIKIQELSKLDLNKLTKLKKIDYIGYDLMLKPRPDEVAIVDGILKKKKLLKLNDLKFCIFGFELSTNKSLLDYPQLNNHPLLFQKSVGYKLLGGDDASHWNTEINFSDLVKVFGDEVCDYASKFKNIQAINSIGIKNHEALFIKFIKLCTNLNVLVLSESNLSPQFYEELPEITLSFTQFIVYEKQNVKINYDFILNFKMLYNFVTSQELSIQFMIKVIKTLKILENIQFKHDKYSITINKLYKNLYDIKCSTNNSTDHKQFLDFDSLIIRLFKIERKVMKKRKNSQVKYY